MQAAAFEDRMTTGMQGTTDLAGVSSGRLRGLRWFIETIVDVDVKQCILKGDFKPHQGNDLVSFHYMA